MTTTTNTFRSQPQPRENEELYFHIEPAYTVAQARSAERAGKEQDLDDLVRHFGSFARVVRYWPEGAEARGYCLFIDWNTYVDALCKAAEINRAADAYCLANDLMYRRHNFPARRWFSRLKRRHPEHAAHWLEEGRKLGRANS